MDSSVLALLFSYLSYYTIVKSMSTKIKDTLSKVTDATTAFWIGSQQNSRNNFNLLPPSQNTVKVQDQEGYSMKAKAPPTAAFRSGQHNDESEPDEDENFDGDTSMANSDDDLRTQAENENSPSLESYSAAVTLSKLKLVDPRNDMDNAVLDASRRSSDRISICTEESDIDRFYHFINPDVITLDNDRFAICRLNIPTAFSDYINVRVIDGGYKAKVMFTTPPSYENEQFILGTAIAEDERGDLTNVLVKAVHEELMERKVHCTSKTTYSLVLDLPFQAEAQTSNELLRGESGQRCNLIPIDRIDQNANKWTGNLELVFKEIGNDFKQNLSVDDRTNLLIAKPAFQAISRGRKRRNQGEHFSTTSERIANA